MPPDSPPVGADLFTSSAQRVIDYLNRNTPLTSWAITRVAGGEQVHLHVTSEHVVEQGTRLEWTDSDSFCHRMVAGAAPVVADTQADPAYADLAHAQVVRAYAGVPLTDDHGELFGVLCGFGREPLESTDQVNEELMTLMGDLLSSNLVAARTADRERRAIEIAQALAQTDALTGLTNRRGWDALVDDAQIRIDAYGDLVAVSLVDLDDLKSVNDSAGHAAGDRLLADAAHALAAVAPAGDRVARYGGDEFAVLANNVPVADLPEHFAVYVDALAEAGIPASMGFAATGPAVTSVTDAFTSADRAMYADKAARSGATA